jgi:YidC/Oxa1 family membrane protein insertase
MLFLAISLLWIAGATVVMQWIWPPPPKPETPQEQVADLPKVNPSKAPHVALLGGAAASAPNLDTVKPVEKPLAEKPIPSAPDRTVYLGAKDWNQLVRLQSLGASVDQIFLNRFQKADWEGKPVWLDEQKTIPAPFELVEASKNAGNPSLLLFHFGNDKDDRPLETLGVINWELIEPAKVEPDQVYSRAVFQTEVRGVRITKTYTLERDTYHLGLEVKLERVAAEVKPMPFRYQMTSPHGLPSEGRWYTNVHVNALMCRLDDKNRPWREFQDLRYITLRGGGDDVRSEDGKHLSYAGTVIQFFGSILVVNDKQIENQAPDFLKSARPTLETEAFKGRIKSIGTDTIVLTDGRATHTLVVPKELWGKLVSVGEEGEVGVVFRTDAHDQKVVLDVQSANETNPLFQNDITVRVNTEPIDLKPGQSVTHKYLVYNGPVKVRLLDDLKGDLPGGHAVPPELVQRYLRDLHLETLTDYHFQGQGFPAWFSEHISSPIYLTDLIIATTNLMHWLLTTIHGLIPNWGLCIILLTVLVRGMMFPLSRKSALMSQRMQALAPEIKKLQEKYKDDKQELTRAQMELWRKHKVNPLGSCWIVFLQMPVFMGLYYAFQESIHFRLADFLWMPNLAAPDMLIRWGEKIPWLSRPQDYGSLLYLGPFFNLLPVIAVALMISVQSLMAPPPTDENAARTQKMMKYMSIFFGLMFYKVASGLCIYFIASSLWGIAERKLLPKRKPDPAAPPPEAKPGRLQRIMDRLQDSQHRDGDSGNGSTKPASTAPAAVTNPSPGQSRKAKRKAARNKRRGGREEAPAPRDQANSGPPTSAPPSDRSSSGVRDWWTNLRRRLGAWWENLLEQARKK